MGKAVLLMSGPFICRSAATGKPPGWVLTETAEQRAGREFIEAVIARELGLCAPIRMGADIGQCPGGAEYGRGLNRTTVHSHGCCERWEEARRQRLREMPRGEMDNTSGREAGS